MIKNGEGQTAEDLAEKVKEDEIVVFLKECAKGTIPSKAPGTKVRKSLSLYAMMVGIKLNRNI